MPRSAFCGSILALALASGPMAATASAQAVAGTDSLLDRMTGSWVLTGTIARQQTTHDVLAEWVLGREYIRLHEVSRERDAGGAPAYEAIVLLGADPTRSGGYACLWLDNTGGGGLDGRALGHAPPARGDSIAYVFALPDGSRIHTTFAYDRAAASWKWLIDNESADGKLQPFARVTLTRTPGR